MCRGCKRFAHEVVDWNRYSETEKLLVIERLEALNLSAVRSFVRVTNARLLRQRLEAAQVAFNAALAPECWVLPLLWRGLVPDAGALKKWGLELLESYRDMPLRRLAAALDDACYQLAEDHYGRHFIKGDSPDWG